MSIEQRRHPRLNTFGRFDIRAHFQHKGQKFDHASVVSLSKSGAFLALPQRDLTWFSANDLIGNMSFTLHQLDGVVFGGRVVYVLTPPEGDDRLGGCGVEFTHLNLGDAEKIAEFVNANLADTDLNP
ncbi:MAG: PilZ domain-containing protein [Acidobacteria bacterium]|nr:PilZ domain-containing protein [Acidobacteriota bacterium]